MSAFRKDFEETFEKIFEEIFVFLIKDDELLEKNYEIWKKVSNTIKKGFNTEPVYDEKYLKTKIKSYEGKIIINFHNDKILKEGSQSICLLTISIDSVFRTSKNYYPQVFLEECKYVFKEKEIPGYITDDIEISSDDCDREDYDYSDKEKPNEESKFE